MEENDSAASVVEMALLDSREWRGDNIEWSSASISDHEGETTFTGCEWWETDVATIFLCVFCIICVAILYQTAKF